MKSFKQHLEEKNLLKTLGSTLLSTALIGGGFGAAAGVAAPHIRNWTKQAHTAIGDPVGGAVVSQAREEAANKVGLFGSNVPTKKRAAVGAGVGVALLSAARLLKRRT